MGEGALRRNRLWPGNGQENRGKRTMKVRTELSSFPALLGGKPGRAERLLQDSTAAEGLWKGGSRCEEGVSGMGEEKAADGCNGMHGGVRGNGRLRRQNTGRSRESVKLGTGEMKGLEI